MPLPLTGKVALVTGGSRGIGAAVARRLAADGAHVALSYNASPDRAGAVVAEITAAGGSAAAFAADAADPSAVASLVDAAVARFGRLDVLVNNAGVAAFAAVADETDESYDHQFDVNVRGVFAAVRAAAPHLADDGRVVTIGSTAGRSGFAGLGVYGATKAAVTSMTRSWAKEFAPRRITVNTVSPGPIDTEMNPSDPGLNSGAAHLAGSTALGRYGTADEVAAAVSFLASPEASYITGVDLAVDGGATA